MIALYRRLKQREIIRVNKGETDWFHFKAISVHCFTNRCAQQISNVNFHNSRSRTSSLPMMHFYAICLSSKYRNKGALRVIFVPFKTIWLSLLCESLELWVHYYFKMAKWWVQPRKWFPISFVRLWFFSFLIA